MKELIVDVSHWNDPVDYQALKAAGFVGLIAKSGGSLYPDDMLAVHAAGARAAGLLLGLYYWVDPLLDECAQGKHLIQQAIDYKADFLAADNEQWWASWALWRRAMQRKIA
jgi:GH25 family lysozyme M1 (1,4-beta-N-acetylmuramidase)